MNLFRKKPIQALLNESGVKGASLRKELSAFDLTMLGIGAIIGTGIFVLTGVAAAEHAGPALVLSFALSALACVFAALCYAEFASTVPVSGSAYTYSYAAFGELIAWILGWDLILEYGVASSAVAAGWSGYFQGLLAGFGIELPKALTSAYDPEKGTIIDLPAIFIVLFITILLNMGAKKSARFNAIIVFVKVAVILLFLAVGVWYVKPENWTPFMPYGFAGVATGAATVFFAYIGFDAVSTAAEEVRNPQRNMPIGIIVSLLVCTLLYIAVSLVLTGIVPYDQLNVKNPVAFALSYIQQDWVAGFISLGAIAGITTVLLVMLYGQTRLFYAISRDGLLPKVFARISPTRQIPYVNTWLTGAAVSVFAGVIPLNKLAELTNIGTLFAFITVSIGVLVLRKTQPDLKRAFRVPFVPFVPILAVLFCGYLVLQLPATTWIGFVSWLLIGLVIYFAYGRKHSVLNETAESEEKVG
ncbi:MULTISPECIES: amino acid permease [Geobacillus]|jgi:APA family basic amino acid/polyamine antiporter|uniref:Amino acid permease n=1 Tax=Geobacillus thermodenitrificans TaxID=33940 RepID=A0ABY9QF06_GEOTD|nr:MULTISPECIES: amino acid permease [Geobacillus]ARP41926.1 putative amino acid permease YhdG [Geobacillus thermodenitrificans]KQB94142.1 putative amino acid permease YfnA [Geobacillus sp. PA-3]MED4918489.1 amino acid permease [Geobacillus thermodenitrificans]NNU87082.1 amino acid permease [Geobacillus sp. MR]OQP10696.1 amino acid permease [Geobacillus sp. 47C-IIb]